MIMVFYPITSVEEINKYVTEQLDNFYDANGLADYECVPDGINVFWKENNEPTYSEVMTNINNWIRSLLTA